ncbi:MAG: rRNA pseudouridine synthase [Ruminococcaceae bacterium]|nr:rRNA pseudouridine synthase [Oscillospiraceae bacterium]
MRLDKLFSDAGLLSRRDCARAVSRGEIVVDGVPASRADMKVDEAKAEIFFRGERVGFSKFVYVMMNKPEGYISATTDGRLPVVTELLPEELKRRGLFPCGRLDKDTTGFMLLTDDGQTAHRLLSPKHHVEKVYAFTLDAPLPEGAEARFLAGVRLGDEICKPAALALDDGRTAGEIVLTEGKYHQIKRMMQREGCTVTSLARISFGGIPLDEGLSPGAWRYLTEEETAHLLAQK